MQKTFNWNPVSCCPEDIDAPILVWTNNDKLMTFKDTKCFINRQPVSHWQRLVEKYKIKYWCYQSQLMNN